MSEKALWAWAIGATVVAVGAIGFSVGKHVGSTTIPLPKASANLNTTDGADANVPLPGLTIPKIYENAPKEWRSRLNENETRGYAILFDPARNTLVVEDCLHKGYQVDVRGRPVRPSGEFCENVVWTSIVSLTDDEMVVQSKQGRTIEIAVSLNTQTNQSVLSMSFDEHNATLIPGSKQDLFVAMESVESIANQKEAFHQASMGSTVSPERLATDRLEEQRRQQEAGVQEQSDSKVATGNQIPADIPRYVIQEVSPSTE